MYYIVQQIHEMIIWFLNSFRFYEGISATYIGTLYTYAANSVNIGTVTSVGHRCTQVVSGHLLR